MPGLDSVLERLRDARQAELARYSLDSALGDIRERLDDVIAAERRALERRAAEAAESAAGPALEAIIERKRVALD
uniref:hypothetical protein n=1 Tax=Salmonella sp. SAL04286 TaxID=3159864 RepID=UPI00397D4A37